MTKIEFGLSGVTTSGTPDGLDPAAVADVLIIGAGFAGSLMAVLLARQGLAPVVIDPYETYPEDFRCEKLSADQAARLKDLGVAEAFGPLAGDLTAQGFRYGDAVNGLRRLWPDSVRLAVGKVLEIIPGPDRTEVILQGGARLSARLVVLASGPGEKLRNGLGLFRTVTSPAHSLTLGLDIVPAPGMFERLDGWTSFGARAGDGVGYASFFRIGNALRANVFLYDDHRSPRAQRFRAEPIPALIEAMPELQPLLVGASVRGVADLRVVDLYAVEDAARDGVVLIGDARRTSCPASGTGLTRILSDAALLSRTYIPRWLAGETVESHAVADFYADPALRALDADMQRRSVNGRQTALNTSSYWRARRAVQALRRRLKRTPHAARPVETPLQTGAAVVVRSAVEILATLDAEGRCEGVPFMPEMVPMIGRPLTVQRRADRTCVEGYGLRSMASTVFLETARCDGSAHDGCQRDCLIFWKEAWLRRADAPAASMNRAAEASARVRLASLATRRDDRYHCQSTDLPAASSPLSRTHARQLLAEVASGEMAPGALAAVILRALHNKARRAIGLPEAGLIVGADGRKSRGALDLKPGDWVRIRSVEEIRATLDATSRNLGLTFEPEMTRYIGAVRQVESVVERMVSEETGRMVKLSRTVVLRQTYCEGVCSKGCPRANPLFWREAWLERVAAPN